MAQNSSFKFFVLGDTFIDILVNGVPTLPKAWGTDTLVESIDMALGGSAMNVAHILGTTAGFHTEYCSIGTFSKVDEGFVNGCFS